LARSRRERDAVEGEPYYAPYRASYPTKGRITEAIQLSKPRVEQLFEGTNWGSVLETF